MKRRLVISIGLLVTITACKSATDACPGPSPKLIYVYVKDGSTGTFAASGATVIARDGAYTDSVVAPSTAAADTAAIGAVDRAGVYVVSVRKAGFLTWTRDSVLVQPVGSCANASPITLQASLQHQF